MISATLPRRLLDKGDRKGNPVRDEGLGREWKVLAIKGRAWRNKKAECERGIRIDGPFPLSKLTLPNSANENRPTEHDKKEAGRLSTAGHIQMLVSNNPSTQRGRGRGSSKRKPKPGSK